MLRSRDQLQAREEALTPGGAQSGPVRTRPAQRVSAFLGRGLGVGRPAGGPLAHPQLVPLDLEGDQRGYEVVHVGGAGQQHRVGAVAGVVPAPPARRGVGLLPVVDHDAVAREDLGLLAHDHQPRAGDLVGQPADRIDEGSEVGLVGAGQRVQARVDLAVRGLEHAQSGLAARAQQRVVGALVELDLVAEPRRRKLVGRAGQRESGHHHRLLLDVGHADGGRGPGTADHTCHHHEG